MNSADKSCVKNSIGNDFDWETAFSNNILRAGKHYASFTIMYQEEDNGNFGIGVMRPGKANQFARGPPVTKEFNQHFSPRLGHGECNNNAHCCMFCISKKMFVCDWNGSGASRRYCDGMDVDRMSSGDEIGMLLDVDEGTLSVYKNGRKLGVMMRGLAGPYCWVVSIGDKDSRVTVKRLTTLGNPFESVEISTILDCGCLI